ncbi:MAG: YicC family protein [Roseburia sp.]|jgi:uncharacterized protein (TIGR00255 family)|nr:YicC family protein [Roseburia sp.]
MIKSMTGFGRCETVTANRRFTVEIKSVNHRYLDIGIRMPRQLNPFESAVRGILREYIERGKTDVSISMEDSAKEQYAVQYNAQIAAQYLAHMNEMAEMFGIENDIRVSTLARFPEVLTAQEQPADEKELWADLEPAVRGACERLAASRAAEGERLRPDLMSKLHSMLSHVDFIEERSPVILAEYRGRLEEKVRDLLADKTIDDARIATEITIFADKICVDEETVRLRSHIRSMMDTLERGGAVGRQLDFIAQEMNREANTILSKTNDIRISDTGIGLKTDIEKVREQIQNIE